MIANTLNQILWPEQATTILLETMAGKGSEIGRRFEELREILDRVELVGKMGVCMDICHVFDAGYDIVNDLDGVLTAFDRVIGLGSCAPCIWRIAKTSGAARKTATRPSEKGGSA